LAESALVPAVIRTLRQLDPELPVFDVKPMEAWMRDSVERPRTQMWLLTLLSGIAAVLAGVGIYGVIAFLASLRTREMGVRMALGATPREVLRLILSQGLALGAAGLALGLAGSLALTRLLRSLLFEVEPADPVVFTAAAVALLALSAVASYFPARQASRVDPLTALHHQ
jgi:putative ABC transport system permease protein